MKKLPVFGTVSRAYGFLLGDLATIFRIAWAPMLIAAALNYTYGAEVMSAAINAQSNPAGMSQAMQINFLIGIVAFVANIMVLVALLQVVIFGDRKPGLFVYLWFGATELRLILVYLLLIIAAIAAMIAFGIVAGILGAMTAAIPALGAVLAVVAIGAVFVLIWAALKLSIIPAVVVAEKNLGVERAWDLMKGNALRMFFVVVMTYIPLGLLFLTIAFAILGSDVPPFPNFAEVSASGKAEKEAMELVNKMATEWQTGLLAAMQKHWTEFAIVNFFSATISTALLAGVAGNAYVALAGEPK